MDLTISHSNCPAAFLPHTTVNQPSLALTLHQYTCTYMVLVLDVGTKVTLSHEWKDHHGVAVGVESNAKQLKDVLVVEVLHDNALREEGLHRYRVHRVVCIHKAFSNTMTLWDC